MSKTEQTKLYKAVGETLGAEANWAMQSVDFLDITRVLRVEDKTVILITDASIVDDGFITKITWDEAAHALVIKITCC